MGKFGAIALPFLTIGVLAIIGWAIQRLIAIVQFLDEFREDK